MGILQYDREGEIAPLASATGIIVGVFVVLFGYAPPADASPWPRDPWRVFLSSGSDYFSARGDFAFDPPPAENRDDDRFERIATTHYAELGLPLNMQANFKLIYSTATIRTPETMIRSAGLAEIEGQLQYAIFQNRHDVLSVAALVGRINSLSAGVRPQLQSDGLDGGVKLLYGRTLTTKPVKFFMTAEAGYRRRFGTPADQVTLDLKLGFEPMSRLLLLVDGFNSLSLRNEDPGGADFDIYKIQPSVAFRVWRDAWLQAGFNHEIEGRNVVTGNALFLNIWSSF